MDPMNPTNEEIEREVDAFVAELRAKHSRELMHVVADILDRFASNHEKHGEGASFHEDYGVLMEEVCEYFTEISRKESNRDMERIEREAIDAAAVLIKTVLRARRLRLGQVRACRVCKCTDDNACVLTVNAKPTSPPITCHWVEEDLCSACVGREAQLSPADEEQQRIERDFAADILKNSYERKEIPRPEVPEP